MPEILTKHPDIVKKVLQSAGQVQCGTGAQQQILTQCPPQHFCSLPGGELCVYGPEQFLDMTQLQPQDILTNVNGRSVRKCSLCGQAGHMKNNRLYHP